MGHPRVILGMVAILLAVLVGAVYIGATASTGSGPACPTSLGLPSDCHLGKGGPPTALPSLPRGQPRLAELHPDSTTKLLVPVTTGHGVSLRYRFSAAGWFKVTLACDGLGRAEVLISPGPIGVINGACQAGGFVASDELQVPHSGNYVLTVLASTKTRWRFVVTAKAVPPATRSSTA